MKACKSARVQAIQPSHSLRSHQRPTGSYCSLGECSGLRRPEPRITEVKACKSARVQAIQPSLLYARPKDRAVLTCHLSDCRGLRTGLNEDPVVLGCTSVALRTAGRSWRSSAENRWPDPKRKRPPRKCEAAFFVLDIGEHHVQRPRSSSVGTGSAMLKDPGSAKAEPCGNPLPVDPSSPL